MSLATRWSRSDGYRTILATLPYVINHAVLRTFRTSAQAKASTAGLTHPEFHRVIHDVYCDMFLHGYRQSTGGYRVDRSTGLVVVLFAVFMYVFDDEFEQRRLADATTNVESIVGSPGVAEIWDALGAYLRTTGRGDAIRRYIMSDFLGTGFDAYRRTMADVRADTDVATIVRLVEFDSGRVLRATYDLIRLFNGHAYHPRCAQEFFDLGMAGKYLDDMADYTDDVRCGNPNLLAALAAERPADLRAAQDALAAGDLVTLQWWAEHCPVTYERYMRRTFEHYDRVQASRLRLPLNIYLLLLHSRRFWTVSTVRTSRR